jgi:hypothetical protein
MVHEVAPQVEALRGQLQKLHKEKQWRGDVELEALNVSSFFHSLSLTLEVVAYEKRTGRPHPYRV